MVSGPVGFGASVKVRPTSVDQPRESLYLSDVVFSFDCFSERRILRFFFRFFPPVGALAAMGLKPRWALMYSMTSLDWLTSEKRAGLCLDSSVFNDVRFTVFWLVNRVTLFNEGFHERGSCMGRVGVVDHHVFRFTCFGKIKNFLMTCVR